MPDGASLVVKLGLKGQHQEFASTIALADDLRPVGVPLPAFLSSGESGGFPYILMTRLPGTDLGAAYPTLSDTDKQRIAEDVCQVQQRTHSLPQAAAFGFTRKLGQPTRPTWRQVVADSIDRAATRINAGSLGSTDCLHPLRQRLEPFESYFRTMRPTPFLDDTTTKNVIVDRGRLSGIVDVDWLCYGDPLFVVALTRASLLNAGHDIVYTDAWAALLQLDQRQNAVLRLYTAVFFADFLGELTLRFNGNNQPATTDDVERLQGLLDEQLRQL